MKYIRAVETWQSQSNDAAIKHWRKKLAEWLHVLSEMLIMHWLEKLNTKNEALL